MQDREPGRSSALHQYCVLYFAESHHAIGQRRPKHRDGATPPQLGYGFLQEHPHLKYLGRFPRAVAGRVLQHPEPHKLRSAVEQQRGLRRVGRRDWSSRANNIHANRLTADSAWSAAELVALMFPVIATIE